MSESNNKYLIVGPSWVGDMIMAQSLFIKLKQQNPDVIIDVLAPAWSEPLLDAMPEINDSIVMPLKHGEAGLRKRYQLGKSLRSRGYNSSIILPNSFKSALIPFWAKIPKRIGYKGEMRYGLINQMHLLDKTRLTMTVQRFVALAGQTNPRQIPRYEKPKLIVSEEWIPDTLKSFRLEMRKPVMALCPGAEYGPAKCWPAKHYAKLAKTAIENGWEIWLLGSEKDKKIANEITALVAQPECKQLAGKTSLKQVMILLKLANQVISNDSGLMHIAAAVNSPVVAIYGSSDPSFTPPLNYNAEIAYLHLECSPCFKRECPLGHLKCLNDITPDSVWSLIHH